MRENLRDIYAGAFADKDTPADLIHVGGAVVGEIEDELGSWWSSFDRIATDSSDNSLEIYFEPHVEDLEPTPEQVNAIYAWGFSQFWMNFRGGKREGGTERHYVDPEWLVAVEQRRAAVKGAGATEATAPVASDPTPSAKTAAGETEVSCE